jgi:L-lactate dehydrogenase complex protein LldG
VETISAEFPRLAREALTQSTLQQSLQVMRRYAAVADEGLVVMASGPAHAPESAFLAATHVVVVRAADMVDSLEALWARVRETRVHARMLNMILGPSRTADLGLPARLGAHGPLRVHIILVDPAPI